MEKKKTILNRPLFIITALMQTLSGYIFGFLLFDVLLFGIFTSCAGGVAGIFLGIIVTVLGIIPCIIGRAIMILTKYNLFAGFTCIILAKEPILFNKIVSIYFGIVVFLQNIIQYCFLVFFFFRFWFDSSCLETTGSLSRINRVELSIVIPIIALCLISAFLSVAVLIQALRFKVNSLKNTSKKSSK